MPMSALEELAETVRSARLRLSRTHDELMRQEGELEGLSSALGMAKERGESSIDALDLLQLRIDQARASISQVRDDVRRLEGELEGLKIAYEILGGEELTLTSQADPLPKGRDISPAWRKILSFCLSRSPAEVSIGDIMQFIMENDLKISRNAVRAQLHLYTQRKFLKRVSEGVYRATDAIKRVC